MAATKSSTANTSVKIESNPLDSRLTRLANAHEAVKNYTMGAVTVGFIPLPLIDMAALTVLQLKMLHSLAKCYETSFSRNLAKSLLSSLLGGSAAVTTAITVGSFLKTVPIIGQTSGLISTSAIGAASTYAVGKVFIAHFESGGTLINFDIEKSKEHFQELYEEGKNFVNSERSAEAKA